MIVFDVCGTLFRCNTTFEFVRYSFPYRAAIIFSLPTRVIGRLTKRLFGYDLIRKLAISSFKGFTVQEIGFMSERFYDNVLSSRTIDTTVKLLQDHKANAALVSASIEPVIKVVADRLGVSSYMASELELVDERYTGRLSIDLLGNKSRFLSCETIDLVVTDNKSDMDIVKLSKRAIIITDIRNYSFWMTHKRSQDEIVKI